MTTCESTVLHTLQGIKKRSILGSWVSRIMSDEMQKQTMVHPCIINGQHILIHERGLQYKDPLGHQHILEFAKLNGFFVKEDQRSDFIEGIRRVKNMRRANVVTMMALTATMLSHNVSAKSANEMDGSPSHKTSPRLTQGMSSILILRPIRTRKK
mgnify:CR=1 FL=1